MLAVAAVRRTPESATLRACLDYLRLCGIACWRINVQGVPLHDGSGGYRKAPSKGVADIIGVAPTKTYQRQSLGPVTIRQPIPLAVEVKSTRGRQSPAQREFQRQWEAEGGLYLLCRSVDELREGLRAAGVGVR